MGFSERKLRDGLAGPHSVDWESRYGSVIVSGYEAGSADGMNEKGFVANLLFGRNPIMANRPEMRKFCR